jgi:Family of unknown function (DUF6029)
MKFCSGLLLLLVIVACPVFAESDVTISATDQFEYSYSSETEREIAENWLDFSLRADDFRIGLLLNARQPSEEGFRENEIKHRFFEFSASGFDVRVGHFYGLFGRGLVFSAYENRLVRIDTALDGAIASFQKGRLSGTVLSGTPSALQRDLRAVDLEYDLGRGWTVGGTGLTYFIDETGAAQNNAIRIQEREWVRSARVSQFFSFGDFYAEYGRKSGYDFMAVPDGIAREGHVAYGALNLYSGPVALSLEAKDYDRFAVMKRADGITNLNRPPALTREHVYSLLGRNAHNLDPDNETGWQAELSWSLPRDWNLIANSNRTETQGGELLFEETYLQIENESLDNWRAKGAFGYQDAQGRRQTGVGEVTWLMDDRRSLTMIWEHQHVTGENFDRFVAGEWDVDYLTLEFATAPAWSLSGILELNNKYPLQRDPGEKAGPFPALQLSYAAANGSSIAIWAGKRQAGQVCSGGVCKFEPAFEGVEIFGLIRY